MELEAALGIVTNPFDLFIMFTEGSENDPSWSVRFSRGAGKEYLPITAGSLSKAQFPVAEAVLVSMETVLLGCMLKAVQIEMPAFEEDLMERIMQALGNNPTGVQLNALFREVLSDDGVQLPEGYMTLEHVDRILTELRESQRCDTSKWEEN